MKKCCEMAGRQVLRNGGSEAVYHRYGPWPKEIIEILYFHQASLSAAHILRSSPPSLFYCITSILQFFNSLICLPSSTDLPVTVTTTASSIKRVIERLSIIIIIMPRFFDDYSNTYLTHDSAAGRKQQRRGWKFRENFKVSCFVWFAVLHNNIVAIARLAVSWKFDVVVARRRWFATFFPFGLLPCCNISQSKLYIIL